MQFFFKPNPFKSWKWSCFIEQLKNLPFLLRDAVAAHSLRNTHEMFLNRSDFYYAVQSALSNSRTVFFPCWSTVTLPEGVWNLIFLVLPVLRLSKLSLPPAPTSCPVFSRNFHPEKQQQVKEQMWEWNARSEQPKLNEIQPENKYALAYCQGAMETEKTQRFWGGNVTGFLSWELCWCLTGRFVMETIEMEIGNGFLGQGSSSQAGTKAGATTMWLLQLLWH